MFSLWTSALSLYRLLKDKVVLYLGLILAILSVVAKLVWDARKAGADSANEALQARNKKIEDEWTQIDNAPVDFDAAVKRLRQRSDREGRT